MTHVTPDTTPAPSRADTIHQLREQRDRLLEAALYTLRNLDAARDDRLIIAPRWFQAQLGESARGLRTAIAATQSPADPYTQAEHDRAMDRLLEDLEATP